MQFIRTCQCRIPKVARGILVLFSVTFLFVLPLLCWKLPHSVYFYKGSSITEINRMKKVNEERLVEAEHYFKKHMKLIEQANFPSTNNTKRPFIAVTIVTVKRMGQPHYLTQCLYHFMEIVKKMEDLGQHWELSVCNVDSVPLKYQEAQNLSEYVTVLQPYARKRPGVSNLFEKEKRDYAYCLNETLSLQPEFALVVEDDALPHPDFIHIFPKIIQRLMDKKSHSVFFNTDMIAYIKFYHPERLLGYFHPEPNRIPELIMMGFILGAIMLWICKMFKPRLSDGNVNCLWITFSVYCMLCMIAIGRVNIMEIRRLSHLLYNIVPAPTCCSPAMLFPPKCGQEIVSFLNKVECKNKYAKDDALNDFVLKSKLKPYYVEPNLFQHIGLYSSIRLKILDPFVV